MGDWLIDVLGRAVQVVFYALLLVLGLALLVLGGGLLLSIFRLG